MKLTKIISSAGHALWESIRRPQCNNDQNKQETSRKLKDEKNKLSKLKTERTPLQSTEFLKYKVAKVGRKSLAINQVNILKENDIDVKKKHKKPCKDNIDYNNKKKLSKISSEVFFKRKFSKYNDVGHKLEAKFKSSNKNCGHFDPIWTKYKAYVNTNQNKKNKSYLKYEICSSGSSGSLKKKKRTAPCADLPGKGTYNHRIAYDEALKLHRKGFDVDVLYKVKNNKTDSIYVVNGRFLHAKNAKGFSRSKKQKFGLNINNINQNQIGDDNSTTEDEKQSSLEEEALWLAELAKIRKDKETQKNRLANIASVHRKNVEKEKKEKLKKLFRDQKIMEAEKEFRAEQLKKIAYVKALKESRNQEQEARNETEKLVVDLNRQNTDLREQIDHSTKMKRSKRLQSQQNLLAHKNIIGNSLYTKHANALGEYEVIVDPDVINDIARWALHNDGNARAVSWLKIVADRIDSLDGRVSQFHKNKWMRMAIDRVVDSNKTKRLSNVYSKNDMSHRKSTCKKIAKVPSTFVIKTKRTAVRCQHERAACRAGVLHESRKFTSVCPGRGDKTYELIKTAEGSYFQVISVDDAFGLCGAEKRTDC